MTPSEWAAWVQAVGSVAAIVGSVWLVHRRQALQLRAEEARERRAQIAEIESLERPLAEVLVFFRVARANAMTDRDFNAHVRPNEAHREMRRLEVAMDHLRTFISKRPLHILDLFAFDQAVSKALAVMRRGTVPAEPPFVAIEATLAEAQEALNEAVDALDLMVSELRTVREALLLETSLHKRFALAQEV